MFSFQANDLITILTMVKYEENKINGQNLKTI